MAFAAARGRLGAMLGRDGAIHAAGELGPLMEFLCAVRVDGTISPADILRLVVGTAGLQAILPGLVTGQPCRQPAVGELAGFHRMGTDAAAAEDAWISFLIAARRATTAVGFPAREGAQVVAALRELGSNVTEHSGAPASGLAAFKATVPGRFEFVVADHGRGALASLRTSPDYASLASHAQALRLALEEGESRKGRGVGHGNGFRPIFSGLADMGGHLRFRSGDHTLVVDGRFDLTTAALAQKAMLPGFLAMVSCKAGEMPPPLEDK